MNKEFEGKKKENERKKKRKRSFVPQVTDDGPKIFSVTMMTRECMREERKLREKILERERERENSREKEKKFEREFEGRKFEFLSKTKEENIKGFSFCLLPSLKF